MTTSADYLNLITSQWRGKPKFTAMLGMYADWAADTLGTLTGIPQDFDLDAAVGAQLDVLAQWVGASRAVTIHPNAVYPVPAQPYTLVLSDAQLRRFIRGRIAANEWDGTAQGVEGVFAAFFTGVAAAAAMVDNQDMSVDLYIVGTGLDAFSVEALVYFLLPVRPAGVRLRQVWVSPFGPLFGLDIENQFIAGPDVGAFGYLLPGN